MQAALDPDHTRAGRVHRRPSPGQPVTRRTVRGAKSACACHRVIGPSTTGGRMRVGQKMVPTQFVAAAVTMLADGLS